MTAEATPSPRNSNASRGGPEATIGPTPERIARAIGEDGKPLIVEIEVGDDNTNWRAFRLNDAPLGRLFHRKTPDITRDQFNAGEMYYAIAYYARMMPSGVVDPSREVVDGGQYKHTPDRLIAAKARYERIIKAMNYDLWHVADAIVVQEIPVAEYAQRFQRIKEARARRTVTVDRLCMALDWLVLHFDIGTKPGKPRVHVGERPSHRPELQDRGG